MVVVLISLGEGWAGPEDDLDVDLCCWPLYIHLYVLEYSCD